MDRRRLLLLAAGGVLGAAVGRGTAELVADREGGAWPVALPAAATPQQPPGTSPPPSGVVDRLPGTGSRLALTIDDGVSSAVVAAFAELAADTGLRLTFFPNGCYRSWSDNARALRPLVDSGQVALGNHTWSHADLRTLDDAAVAEDIGRNRRFLADTFGAGETPFFRPPYGSRDERVDRIAADCGHPTVAMWEGTLGDHRVLGAEELMAAARRWFAAQCIVIGHANHDTVTTVLDQLVELIEERALETVTLADVWAAPR
ncbi:polysaccharide deacetylase family protein [Trujillonella endophytica]|uniref:Peptidoglycan/xylan/chitin deacetylase, PgdA/CDA1 family n=1 Tax=Trujillonella endophytica TaxID=673521 RepID=A0A1H8UN73_9ACTN|nr:polysaccharide deacetylase family protein [Trujillella endophytica]SEP04659.1 Peptidoglycan/xylan/chitin deacetylase, PgdA/CDA1 family [Trujillella endophytica]